jgi:hypothetical protein
MRSAAKGVMRVVSKSRQQKSEPEIMDNSETIEHNGPVGSGRYFKRRRRRSIVALEIAAHSQIKMMSAAEFGIGDVTPEMETEYRIFVIYRLHNSPSLLALFFVSN